MTSFMIDSTLIIEHLKGNPIARKILEVLIDSDVNVYINDVVASEVIFIYLKLTTGKSYLTLKKNPVIVRSVDKTSVYELLGMFKFLETNEFVFSIAKRLIDKYGLLPNDALILATAIFYRCDYLIALDSDYKEPCEAEKIRLISTKEELEKALHNH
ncbi:type II toxin-antitoxin system VapC family toxin [Pyrococcus abyssi]|uniref:Nucleic acid-binding protein n=1 Tax=Pyrococcus abyssi (strain GE5 / Orsay) TaxID=272844 RepID=Q9V0I4_PYRAB|nr:type II toxin-antitoxin system VapC family toxin [Pyrococcus abyssi]CAB49719.1 Predicted nucleic acid-binding protein, contains PIN domain [Pyrococcus abyssi GE5]CCE70205.1 TPA: nucleic acid-binding protein [Pyrococcus abyssi GE5]